MSTIQQTKFAPAERANAEDIASDAELILRSALLDHLTATIPCILLVLNKQRQVVFENKGLLDNLGLPSGITILGRRPGEIVNCIHAAESPAGCGTSESCGQCGAVLAVLQSQAEGIATVRECTIRTASGESYEFTVRASPYALQSRAFTLVSLLDISDRKRREALERTFFHDVNNILMAVTGYAQLLADASDSHSSVEYVKEILSSSNRLVEEIHSHRRLLQAETGELALNISQVNSRKVLDEAKGTFSASQKWRERAIMVWKDSDEVVFTTDRTLLRRVIENMIKNALEATTEQEVHLACRRSESSVVFSVHNAGCIPRQVQLQMFQRSFSTKGKGRGIGTYSMKLFGERFLRGKVWFTTNEDVGTTFYLSVPQAYPENALL